MGRRDARYVVQRKARAIFDDGRDYPCEILNVSKRGALLRIEHNEWLPARFLLKERMTSLSWRVEVAWRGSSYLGVKFIEGTWSVPGKVTFGRRPRAPLDATP